MSDGKWLIQHTCLLLLLASIPLLVVGCSGSSEPADTATPPATNPLASSETEVGQPTTDSSDSAENDPPENNPPEKVVEPTYVTPEQQAAIGLFKEKRLGYTIHDEGTEQWTISLELAFDLKDEHADRKELLKLFPNMVELDVSGNDLTDADMEVLSNCTQLRSLNLTFNKITDAGLEHLKGLTNLQHLQLGYLQLTDAGLAHLSEMKDLRTLNLHPGAEESRFTPDGLEHLQHLDQLEHLTLASWKITPEGISHLAAAKNLQSLDLTLAELTDDVVLKLPELFPNLVSLSLGATDLSDKGMEGIGKLTKLEFLEIQQTEVTSAGMGPIANLTELKELRMLRSKIGDEGLAPLADLRKLTHLEALLSSQIEGPGLAYLEQVPLEVIGLGETQVNDEGVTHLAKIKTLKNLVINDCRVSDAAIPTLLEMKLDHLRIDGGDLTLEGKKELRDKFTGKLDLY